MDPFINDLFAFRVPIFPSGDRQPRGLILKSGDRTERVCLARRLPALPLNPAAGEEVTVPPVFLCCGIAA